jgi:thiamine biosynthesis protein ThiS
VTATVNGVQRECADGATLAVLLDDLGAPRDGVAVAVNDRVIPRSEHARLVLRDGDRVEVVHAVAGG